MWTEEVLRCRAQVIVRITAICAVSLVAACGKSDATNTADSAETRARRGAAPVESTTVGGGGATGGAPERSGAPRGLFIGTSLTAGLGLSDPASESWPGVVQHLADSTGVPLLVVNSGLSGETSAGALRRADWVFGEPYDLVVIETGANDGLRGVDPDSTAANIAALIAKARAANPRATVMLVQMEAPTNLGPRYTRAFHDLFPRVARETGAVLLPFLLDGVGGVPRMNQGDGIHPTAEGARMAALNVWPGIRFALRQR